MKTIESLENVYKSGTRDDETVRSLDEEYTERGKWDSAGRLFEEVAATRSNWREQAWYLKRAVVRFYHVEDWDSSVRCHQRLIQLVPGDQNPEVELDVWCPAGMAFGYAHTGRVSVVISQLDRIAAAFVGSWSLYGRFLFHLVRSLVFRETKDWVRALEEGSEFTAWAKALAPDDIALRRSYTSIDEGENSALVGESGRLYCICSMLTELIVKAEVELGQDSAASFDDLGEVLSEYKLLCVKWIEEAESSPDNKGKEKAEYQRKRFATCLGKAGVSSTEAGQYEQALGYFDQELEWSEGHYGSGAIYRAASLVGLDQPDKAMRVLSEISSPITSNGRGVGCLSKLQEFKRVIQDPTFVSILKRWS